MQAMDKQELQAYRTDLACHGIGVESRCAMCEATPPPKPSPTQAACDLYVHAYVLTIYASGQSLDSARRLPARQIGLAGNFPIGQVNFRLTTHHVSLLWALL
jgi:hypothetical protein